MSSVMVPTQPQLTERPPRRMAVVRTTGDPNQVAGAALGALFGSVEALRQEAAQHGREIPLKTLRARWPNVGEAPAKEHLLGVWGLPVPDDVSSLPQVVPGIEVSLETWTYGTVCEILHRGPFSTEPATLERLEEFLSARGFQACGDHEEEYLTPPGAPDQRTLIRYPVAPLAPLD